MRKKNDLLPIIGVIILLALSAIGIYYIQRASKLSSDEADAGIMAATKRQIISCPYVSRVSNVSGLSKNANLFANTPLFSNTAKGITMSANLKDQALNTTKRVNLLTKSEFVTSPGFNYVLDHAFVDPATSQSSNKLALAFHTNAIAPKWIYASIYSTYDTTKKTVVNKLLLETYLDSTKKYTMVKEIPLLSPTLSYFAMKKTTKDIVIQYRQGVNDPINEYVFSGEGKVGSEQIYIDFDIKALANKPNLTVKSGFKSLTMIACE